MAVSEKFRNTVGSGDLEDIRLSLCNALILDTTFRDFAEMEKLAAKVPGLYVPYDNGPMDTNAAHWDDDYLGLQKVKLEFNFCPERIEHLKAVVLKLHPPKPAGTAHESASKVGFVQRPTRGADWPSGSHRRSSPSYEEQKRADANSGRIVKVVGCGVGGAILGGAVAGSATGGVLGALVGCGVGYVISKR